MWKFEYLVIVNGIEFFMRDKADYKSGKFKIKGEVLAHYADEAQKKIINHLQDCYEFDPDTDIEWLEIAPVKPVCEHTIIEVEEII